ncbi:hypothetical protein B7463_g157, partial [Scytalidium lignicola]
MWKVQLQLRAEPPLGVDQRAQAKRRFDRIINHFEAVDNNNNDKYKRTVLLCLMYEHARSEKSRDIFLKAFFQSMKLSMDEDVDFDNKNVEEELRIALFDFADYLLDSFFLPSLRGACLVRDHHRCVISRRFDQDEAINRLNDNGNNAKDDDNNLLFQGVNQFEPLEVAYILPHSLTKGDPSSHLNSSKKAAFEIPNMFDHGVLHLIEGTDIDRPHNALTLGLNFHRLFGDFRVFFTPLSADQQPHTYRIETFLPSIVLRDPLPVTRTLYLTETRTIDLPSPRLLAIHRAIAHILHLSAAGGYINRILKDMEEKGIQADGSTELARFVRLRLGWGSDGTGFESNPRTAAYSSPRKDCRGAEISNRDKPEVLPTTIIESREEEKLKLRVTEVHHRGFSGQLDDTDLTAFSTFGNLRKHVLGHKVNKSDPNEVLQNYHNLVFTTTPDSNIIEGFATPHPREWVICHIALHTSILLIIKLAQTVSEGGYGDNVIQLKFTAKVIKNGLLTNPTAILNIKLQIEY